MRSFFYFLCTSLLFLNFSLSAQDKILTIDAEINGKVSNVTTQWVKYTLPNSSKSDSLSFAKVKKILYAEPTTNGACEILANEVKYVLDWENVAIVTDFCQVADWKKYKEISAISLDGQNAIHALMQLAAMKGQHSLVLTSTENVQLPCLGKADKNCRVSGVKISGIPYSDSMNVPTQHDFDEFFGNNKKFVVKSQYSANFKEGKGLEKLTIEKQFVIFEKKVSNGIMVLTGRLGKLEGNFRLVYNEASSFVVYFEDPKLNVSYNFVIDFSSAVLPSPVEEEPEKDE